jgi:hypothetical protein
MSGHLAPDGGCPQDALGESPLLLGIEEHGAAGSQSPRHETDAQGLERLRRHQQTARRVQLEAADARPRPMREEDERVEIATPAPELVEQPGHHGTAALEPEPFIVLGHADLAGRTLGIEERRGERGPPGGKPHDPHSFLDG